MLYVLYCIVLCCIYICLYTYNTILCYMYMYYLYYTGVGSITSVQAVYVPADDLTDPAPATTFAHLDATTVLSRQIAELGVYSRLYLYY